MRYFTGSTALFDAMRSQVMAILSQPNGKAEEPWPEGITTLALGQHEYAPPEYQALIAYALANGGSEVTEAEYLALQPEPTEP
jgi:hypothetical protein